MLFLNCNNNFPTTTTATTTTATTKLRKIETETKLAAKTTTVAETARAI